MTAGERRWARDAQHAIAKAAKLEEAIREHYRQVVHHENWGADDDLWAVLNLRRPRERASAA